MSWLLRNRFRSTTARRSIAWRYITLVVASVAGFALIPFYLRHIPMGLYGYWLASGYFLTAIVSIDPGLTTVLQQRVAHCYARRDWDGLDTYISGGLLVSAAVSLTIVALGLVGKDLVPYALGITSPIDQLLLTRTLTFAIIAVGLSFFSFSVSAVNLGLQSSIANGAITLFANIVSPLLSIVMLARGFGLDAISIPMFLNGLLLAILQTSYLVLRLRAEKASISFSLRHAKPVLRLLSFTFVGRTASIVATNLDSLIVARMVSPEALVALVITRKAFDYGKEIVNQLIVALQPSLAHLSASQDPDRTRAVVMRLTTVSIWGTGFLVGGLLCLNGDFVRLWVSEGVFLGGLANALLGLSFVATLVATSLINVGMSFGQFRSISRGILLQSVLLVLCLLVGTKAFGLYGAILAPAVAIILSPLWTYCRALESSIAFGPDARRRLLAESVKSAATGLLASVVMLPFNAGSWSWFVVLGVTYSLLFGIVGVALSRVLRREVAGALDWAGIRGIAAR